MGEVRVSARIGPSADVLREVEFLVDTGTFYSFIPTGLAEDLGLDLRIAHRGVTADSRPVELKLGIAYIAINGRGAAIIVGGLDVPIPLLGVEALEALGFKVNPVEGTLEQTRPFPETPILTMFLHQ